MRLKTITDYLRITLVKAALFGIFSSAVIIYYLITPNLLDTFELKTLDYRFKLRGTKKVESEINIVFIGNKDIEDIGIWPWRRYYHAFLIDALRVNGAKTIGFDVLFTDKSKKEFADDDFALALSAKEAGNVNLISFFGYFSDEIEEVDKATESPATPLVPVLERYSFKLPKGKGKFFRKATKHTVPIQELLDTVQGIGHADFLRDEDGITRKLPILVNYDNRLYMSFPLLLVCSYLDITTKDIQINPGESVILKKDDKVYTIPIDNKGEMIINFNHKLEDFDAYSYNEVIQSDHFPESAIHDLKEFKDKIAVVGVTYTGNTDLHPTPHDPKFPFLCLEATVADNILQQDFIYRLDIFWRILIIIISCFFVSFLCSYTKPYINSGIILITSVSYLYISIFVFKRYGIWMDIIYPLIAIILLPYVLMTTIHYMYALFENIRYLERMKYLGNLVESSHDAIFSFDLEGHIISWNSGAVQIYGYETYEVLEKPWEIFVPPDKEESLLEIIKKAKAGNSTINYETTFIVKEGHTIPVNISVSPIIGAKGETSGVSIISQDLTERKKLMEQIMESEKLAEVGRLSAGLAHEIKNPLTPIIFYAQNLAETQKIELEEIHSQGQVIGSEANRILKLATDLLSFSRPKEEKLVMVDVNNVIEDTILLIVYQARKLGAEIEKDLMENIPKIKGEPDKIKQVLINLVMNAAHAMKGKKGTVSLKTSVVNDNGRYFVEIITKDTGSGMPQHVKDNLFKPFFTTKPKGVGTGLGLYISYNIIKQFDGNISVESEEGVGTTFFIKLPVTQEQA